MKSRVNKGIPETKITHASFFKRLYYKWKFIMNPSLDPKIVLFSRLEKQSLFYIFLFVIVFVSVYLIIEFGYISIM